jgi:dCTP deaminase
MILTAERLGVEIAKGNSGDKNGIAVVPSAGLSSLGASGEASITLRLGRWFLTMRHAQETHIELDPSWNNRVKKLSKNYFVPFGSTFVLHPGRFVLASTLEWIRLPRSYAAFVVGKSKLGRRGIIIETAAGVHPGFSGCLTLEIANVGEIPVRLIAGMTICQLFFHTVDGGTRVAKTELAAHRKPRMGEIGKDPVLQRLVTSRSE